jgi:hypothetical protein
MIMVMVVVDVVVARGSCEDIPSAISLAISWNPLVA